MDDVLRKHLTEAEIEEYDRYDRRASIAGHLFVWPGIAGLVSYMNGRYASAMVCLVIVLVAFPTLVLLGKRARRIRERAQARFSGQETDGPGQQA